MTIHPKSKPKSVPKFTDTERHARFLDMAREVEASEKPDDFDKVFNDVVLEPFEKMNSLGPPPKPAR